MESAIILKQCVRQQRTCHQRQQRGREPISVQSAKSATCNYHYKLPFHCQALLVVYGFHLSAVYLSKFLGIQPAEQLLAECARSVEKIE